MESDSTSSLASILTNSSDSTYGNWFLVSLEVTDEIGWHALTPALVLMTLAILAVLSRSYTRAFLMKRTGVDDWLLIVALIFSIAMTSLVGAEVAVDDDFHKKGGDHHNQSHPDSAPTYSKMMALVYAHSICFHVAINLIKCSILITYLRIFTRTPLLLGVVQVCFLLLAIAAGWGILGVAFMCDPVQKYWNPSISGSCLDAQAHFLSSGVMGVALDWIIWILPMRVVARLNMKGRQRYGMFLVFGLGGFVCVVSVLRLAFVQSAAKRGEMERSGTYAVVWSSAEVNVALICASLLVLKPLFLHLSPRLDTSYATGSRSSRVRSAHRRWPRSMDATLMGSEEEIIVGDNVPLKKRHTSR